MVVDDDTTLRQLLAVTFATDDCEIVEAVDGHEALALVEADRPDLVLLDWKMTGRSGAEVLGELKRLHPDLPVIVLTAEIQPRHRAEATQLGADTFLTKPFSPLRLIETVERLLPERSGDHAS